MSSDQENTRPDLNVVTNLGPDNKLEALLEEQRQVRRNSFTDIEP